MNKSCNSCKSEADTDFAHLGPLCRGCFSKILRKRVRKAIKDFGWLKQGQTIFYDDKTAQDKATLKLFKDATPGLNLTKAPADQAEVIIVGRTADDEVVDFLGQLFEGKIDPGKKVLNILENVSTEEIQKYCELENIDGEMTEKTELREKLEGLEKKYRGTVFAIQKSRKSLE